MIRHLLLVLSFLFFLSPAKSQWITYTSQNTQGLVGTIITSIAEDKNKDLWFATDAGVVKYNIKNNLWPQYTIYNGLGDNFVNKVFKRSNNEIWSATNGGGVSKLNSSNSWTTYSTADGLAGNIVKDIAEDDNSNLWFATYGSGVSKFHSSTWTNYTSSDGLASDLVHCVYADADGKLWFGTAAGLSQYDGNSFLNYTVQDGLPSNTITSIAEDANGDLWIATNDGVCRFDGINFQLFTTANGLSDNLVYDILLDTDGKLWFATHNGVSVYDGSSWNIYDTSNGLVSSEVFTIFQHSDQRYWFGLAANGASVFDGVSWLNIDETEGMPTNDISDIGEDLNSDILLSSYYGVAKFDGGEWTGYNVSNSGIITNYITCMTRDHSGNNWFGSYSGASKFDGLTWSNFTVGNGLSVGANCILADSEDNIWFGTSNGVSKYDGTSFTNYTTANGLAQGNVYSICEHTDGTLWVAGYYQISIFNGSSWSIIDPIPEGDYSSINDIFCDSQGTIWVATSMGIIAHYGNCIWVKYTEAGGNVYSIGEDNNGSLWFGCYGKLVIKSGDTWTTYSNFNGVVPYGIDEIYKDSLGCMWLAHGNGVTKADPAMITIAENVISANNQFSVFPNPFESALNITMEIENESEVMFSIYDVNGRLFSSFPTKQLVTGRNNIVYDAAALPKGIYLCKVTVNGKYAGSTKIIKSE